MRFGKIKQTVVELAHVRGGYAQVAIQNRQFGRQSGHVSRLHAVFKYIQLGKLKLNVDCHTRACDVCLEQRLYFSARESVVRVELGAQFLPVVALVTIAHQTTRT